MANTSTRSGQLFNRRRLDSLLKHRLFYTESFEIYRTSSSFRGDNRGFYDYGPPGCALLSNMVNGWRRHFIIEEDMLELDCAAITPEVVLKTSGHVDKFATWMCKDPVKGDYLRADHIIQSALEARLASCRSVATDGGPSARLDPVTEQAYEEILAKISQYDGPELGKLIKKLDIRNPNGNGRLEDPVLLSLMFKSTIGPTAASPTHAYLRPETAQGQILNFRKLLDFHHGRIPFASACIGKSFHNEISPRGGLLKVREFLVAEIEHFVDPLGDLSHERFAEVAGIEMPFLDRPTQLSSRATISGLSVGEAVQMGMVSNETLGYFLARTYLFLLNVGVDRDKVRFRHHLADEMPHYASDCWGPEILTSYGWIQCGGLNDRSAWDLDAHSKATGVPLVAREPRIEPLETMKWKATLDKKLSGPRFGKDTKKIEAALASLSQDVLENLASEMAARGSIVIPTDELSDGVTSVDLPSELCSIRKITHIDHTREYTPNIIELAFGFGRILYGVLEHVYWHRHQDVARQVLSLPIHVAPTKVVIAPLSNNPDLELLVKLVARRLKDLGIANKVDSSAVSIGRRYARNDEMGTPLAVTVDFDTLRDSSVTLRERDSTEQVRGSVDDIMKATANLVYGAETWEQVSGRLTTFSG